MPAPRRATRTPRTPEKANPRASAFFQNLKQFLENKAIIEQLTERNQGDKKKETTGLRDSLLAEVKKRGEADPETGSYFLDLDTPVTVDTTGEVIRRLKAERRVSKGLNADKTRALLEDLKLLDRVEEYQYVLRLTSDMADLFGEWLKESKLIERVVSTDAVLVEDNLLQIHYGRDPHTMEKLVDKKGNSFIDQTALDGLYNENETFAFKPLAR